MLSPSQAKRLKPLLDGLVDGPLARERVPLDPVCFPHRFRRADDIEVAALVASCLAYGRADYFIGRLEEIFRLLGPHPGAFARAFRPGRDGVGLRGFVYRFNVGADVAALISAAGRVQREAGSLGAAFAQARAEHGGTREALDAFVERLRGSVDPAVVEHLGPLRGFEHLLPLPSRGGACKRLLLFLRWMVRGGGGDPIDFGLWPVPASALVIPLDTHLARLGRLLGLTARTDQSWRTAEEVTGSLRRLDPDDPVRYDFALCHLGMSGRCPRVRSPARCRACPLAPACRSGRASLRGRTG
jgi:uncharacterized protein (TIGR02757 family)